MRWKTLTALSFLIVLMIISAVKVNATKNYVIYSKINFGKITFEQSALPLVFSTLYRDYQTGIGVSWHFNATWIYTSVAINMTGFSSYEWFNYTSGAGTQKIYLGVEPEAVYFNDVETSSYSYANGITTLMPTGSTDIDIYYSEAGFPSEEVPIELPDLTQYSYSNLYGTGIYLTLEENCSMCFCNYDGGILVEVTDGTLNGSAIIQYLNDRGTIRFTSLNNATFIVSSYLGATPHAEGVHVTASTTTQINAYTLTGDSVYFWWGSGIEPALPYMFILGIIGVFSFFGGAVYGAKLMKEGEYEQAIINATIFMSLGFGLILAWLMT